MNDAKDKSEKPFAMAFVKLIQENGTTLQNTEHDLIVYKVRNGALCVCVFMFVHFLYIVIILQYPQKRVCPPPPGSDWSANIIEQIEKTNKCQPSGYI